MLADSASQPPRVFWLNPLRLPATEATTLVRREPSTAGSFPVVASSWTTFPEAVPAVRVAAEPRPRAVRAPAAVVAPVPPLARGTMSSQEGALVPLDCSR